MNGFSDILINWYQLHQRDLPWRNTNDPYKIWLSEIILQQTRVEQGLPYYERFIKKFPDVIALAKANEQEVLKLWEGLGYYSRARNLHHTAKIIANDYKGVFPEKYEQILALKGIGSYTASAIMAFAFKKPYAVVDGNVFRVLSRVFLIDKPIDVVANKKHFENLAHELLDKKNPFDYNQAILDFGATVCTPVNPKCDECVLKFKCLAKEKNKIHDLPVKSKKTKKTTRHFVYLIIKDKSNNVFIKKRTANDIWKGLYEFPLINIENLKDKTIIDKTQLFLKENKAENIKMATISRKFKHLLTHQTIHAVFIPITVDTISLNYYLKCPADELKKYPFSKLINNFLKSWDI